MLRVWLWMIMSAEQEQGRDRRMNSDSLFSLLTIMHLPYIGRATGCMRDAVHRAVLCVIVLCCAPDEKNRV